MNMEQGILNAEINNSKPSNNNLKYGIVFLCIVFTSACAQKNEKEDTITSPFKLVYAMDIYRNKVVDSLKYLIPVLDSILESDQKYRYGTGNNPKGKEEQAKAMQRFILHKKEVHFIDSINTLKVSAILDRYGWLGSKRIGIMENEALFFCYSTCRQRYTGKIFAFSAKSSLG